MTEKKVFDFKVGEFYESDDGHKLEILKQISPDKFVVYDFDDELGEELYCVNKFGECVGGLFDANIKRKWSEKPREFFAWIYPNVMANPQDYSQASLYKEGSGGILKKVKVIEVFDDEE